MISISGDYGSEEADEVVGPLHTRLDNLFSSRMRKRYSKEVKEFIIGLRVSGRVCNYREKGPGRLFNSPKHRQLGITLGIPLKAWEHKSTADLERHFAAGVRAAFARLKQQLAKKDEQADLDALEADFEACMRQFVK